MNTFRPEPHVAQQSRRDKLRSCSSLYDTPPPASMFSTSGDLDFAGAPAGEASFHEGVGWAMNSQIHHSPLLIPPNIYHIKHPGVSNYHEVLPHFQNSTSQLYLHDVVNAPSTTNQALDAAGLPSWVDTSNELLLLPSYANPGASSSVWLNRQPNEWYGDHDNFARIKPEGGFAAGGGTSQGLSLSLSSNPVPELQTSSHFDEDLAGNVIGFSSPYPKFSAVGSPQGIAAAAPDPRRGAGPLGPFTGYAAILKNSKFLRPAQQLLDEFCSIASGSKLARGGDGSGRSSGAGESGGSNGRGGNSGVSSSSFYSSTEVAGDGGGSSGACHSQQPEFQHKKAKLLYMQEEVCRRYKQYHQQMQMVVSSFESVAGLSAATPYISLALKAISKHFRCLKNAITDQLRHVSKLLGEEFMSSPGSSKGDTTPRLKYVDPSIRKQKAASENSLSFLDQCQPVWRPQRGLPERAVAVLRAWLFDHFLHPYPTDTDKHMLASQTGLSRNQVSNWFINARVRLWKPMVEEIHMLETKGMSGMDLNSTNRNEGKQAPAPASDQLSEAQSNKLIECSQLDPVLDEGSSRAMEQWHREKRSRMEECGIPTGIDGSLMSFSVYPGAMDVGGLGAVSLTLGLQHNEGAQQQQQQIRRHFGSHMVHDFVG